MDVIFPLNIQDIFGDFQQSSGNMFRKSWGQSLETSELSQEISWTSKGHLFETLFGILEHAWESSQKLLEHARETSGKCPGIFSGNIRESVKHHGFFLERIRNIQEKPQENARVISGHVRRHPGSVREHSGTVYSPGQFWKQRGHALDKLLVFRLWNAWTSRKLVTLATN